MDKIFPSTDAAIQDIFDGAVIAISGSFTCGRAMELTKALARKGVKNLTVISQNIGVGNEEMLEMVVNGQIKKVISNYPVPRSASKGANHPFEQAVRRGEVELETCGIGTFVERLRAAGAGIPAFYTPAGVGTFVAEGKEVRVFEGREYVMERALPVDFAFVHAWKGDREGNLVYRFTGRNYNNAMAMAGKTTIAELEMLQEVGELDSNNIHTPGIFVKRVVVVGRPAFEKALV
jgi:3-oxoacid CoA-transferase subunit A